MAYDKQILADGRSIGRDHVLNHCVCIWFRPRVCHIAGRNAAGRAAILQLETSVQPAA